MFCEESTSFLIRRNQLMPPQSFLGLVMCENPPAFARLVSCGFARAHVLWGELLAKGIHAWQHLLFDTSKSINDASVLSRISYVWESPSVSSHAHLLNVDIRREHFLEFNEFYCVPRSWSYQEDTTWFSPVWESSPMITRRFWDYVNSHVHMSNVARYYY